MVRGAKDSIHERIAHVQVGRCHVDLGPQRARAIGKLTRAHAVKQVKILLDAAIAIRAFPPGFGQGPAILPHFLGAEIADVRFARP